MRKYKVIKSIVILIAFMLVSTNYCFAAKEDLEKEYTKKGTRAADEFCKVLDKLDTDGDQKLSKKEIEKASDEEINILAKAKNHATWGVKQKSLMDNNAGIIDREYNDRRVKYGLEEDNDTEAGNSAELTDTKVKKYYSPDKSSISVSSTKGMDDMMGDAEDFVNNAKSDVGQVDQASLQHFSSTFYNIFLTAGAAIAVIAGMVIGINYMLGSVEGKAEIKKMLLPYIIGCIVVFGSFGIWKLIIELMQNM